MIKYYYHYIEGFTFDDARCEAEIKRRIEIARNTFLAMKGLFKNRKVIFALELRLVNCYLWSVLLYGAETWTINKAMENRITSFEMWIYRRMMKTNKMILHMAGRKQIALVGSVKERKIKYFGHVKRHQSLLKDVLEGREEGSRRRGRPRINREENVKNWSGLKLQECTRMAEDRVKWRDVAINLQTGRRYLDR